MALAGCAAAATAAPASRPPLPLEAFFGGPAARGAQLSPGGRRLALIRSGAAGDSLVVIDLRTRAETAIASAGDGARYDWVRWKGEGRLLAGAAPDRHDRPLDEEAGPGARADETVTALDTGGGRAVVLWSGGRAGAGAARLSDVDDTDPAHVLAIAANGRAGAGLWRVDVATGARSLVSRAVADPPDRRPAGALTVREAAASRPSEPRWARGKVAPAGVAVLGPAMGPGRVYALGRGDGGATVRIYDFHTETMSEPVWPTVTAQAPQIVYGDKDRDLAGVCVTAEVFGCEFRDPGLQADYRRAAHDLGPGHSLTPLSMSQDGRFWLFEVSAPEQRGAYWLMDRTSKALSMVALRYPALPSDRLGRREPYVFTARDGTKIPGYLTLPPGQAARNLPLLVMPHGGPEARDSLTYDRWSQVFATRGYLVFQPNFRGSSGYGQAWSGAGHRQWGGLMQDDLTDGVRSLVASGKADGSRICIMGASYGGYAALYGGATQPDLYKCVVSWAGVSDLAALVQNERKTRGAGSERYLYAREIIGDPKAEKARLERASPISYAASYQPPVLLLHGRRDESVPVEQSERMAQALRAAGRRVSLTETSEGHVQWSEAHEAAALAEIVAFVDRNIGAPTGDQRLPAPAEQD